MKIYAPVKDANGVWATVRFVNGVGETDNPKLIEWFRTHGYKVPLEDNQRIEQAAITPVGDVGTVNRLDGSDFVNLNNLGDIEPNFDAMTPNELREWMKCNGYGLKIKNIRNKEKLLEILRG